MIYLEQKEKISWNFFRFPEFHKNFLFSQVDFCPKAIGLKLLENILNFFKRDFK